MDKYEELKKYLLNYKYCIDLDIQHKKSQLANYTHKNVFYMMQKDKSVFLNNLLSHMNKIEELEVVSNGKT